MQNVLLVLLKLLSYFLNWILLYTQNKTPQEVTYIVFVFNSKEMWVTLTNKKREKILESCKGFFKRDSFTVRESSSLIGTLISTFPGNKFGPLYYLELYKCKCKTLGLKKATGNFDTFTKLTKEAILDLQLRIKKLYIV